MNWCECSQCGVSAAGLVWGFGLLAKHGWGLTPATDPPGAAERSWLCAACGSRAESMARTVARFASPKPRASAPPAAPAAARTRGSAGQQLRVLVVDDHVLMLRSMVRMLAGCETVTTTSAQEALELLLGGAQFDVIVSDVMMPGLTGPELYARCFRHSPELARRFVFASADPVVARRRIDETAARVGSPQAPPLLSKPTSRAALLAAVSAVAANAPHESGTYVMKLTEGVATPESSAEDRTEKRGSRY